MIITSILGENILKYLHLDLTYLPGEGIIAISGENESGKSTIGETICFALFGRTFSLEPRYIKKIIRWGESHCSVIITFRQGSEHYRLSRIIDNQGNHGAKLSRLDNELLIANGVSAVSSAINDLLGYDFDDFINSFYLAQREIITPHPRSETVKIMAGIAPLECVAKKFDVEISLEKQELASDEQKINEIKSDLADLSFDKAQLRILRKQYTTNNDILSELRRKFKRLEQANRHYKETLPLIHASHSILGTTKFLNKLLLLLTIMVSGGWLLLAQFPENPPAGWIVAYLTMVIPNWTQYQIEYLQWSLFGILGMFAWLLFFLVLNAILNRRIQRLEGERISLAVTLRKIYHSANVYRSIEISLAGLEHPADEEVHHIAQRIIDNATTLLEIESIVNRTLTWLHTLSNQYEQMVSSLDATIIREEEKQRKAEHLDGLSKKLDATINEHHRRIAVRHLANELLQGACGRVAQRFNRDVRDLVGMTLPLFTDGRYQYLRIDNDLNVRIFSKEKHDFMDLDEVSSGTQRQTMLALRLTLARHLLERTKGMPQFLFLDELFAFFDESRTRQSLEVLPKLNDNLKQIWVVAQSFREEVKSNFSAHIECLRDKLHQTNR
ncbi:AAA_23 domain-containing protein [Gammaproteobacteria bacterium]